jgi:ferritin
MEGIMKELITIKENLRISGTDIILEKGDRISITNSNIKDLKEATSVIAGSLNDQYNFELQSALVYEQLAHQSRFLGYEGACAYFTEAAKEEFEHAQNFAALIQDLEVLPEINITSYALPEVPTGFIDLIQTALMHEKEVTSRIRSLISESRKLEDYNTEKFLLGFVEEQIDEEAKYNDILSRINSFGEEKTGLLIIDNELKEKAGK